MTPSATPTARAAQLKHTAHSELPARTRHVEIKLTAYRAGKLNRLDQTLVYTQIVGWMDLCSDADRELYRGLARAWKASGAAG